VDPQKYVVASVEERLNEWRDIERAANAAESELDRIGQGANDPRLRDLAFRAKQLRDEADRKFAAILRSVRMDDSQP